MKHLKNQNQLQRKKKMKDNKSEKKLIALM